MLSDMRNAHLGPCQLVAADTDAIQIPQDVYYTLAMGADIGHLPQDFLMTVTGANEAAKPSIKAHIGPGDFCVVSSKNAKLPIVLGVFMESVQHDGEEFGLFLKHNLKGVRVWNFACDA